MFKPFLLFTAVILIELAPASAPARPPQESAPTHAAKSSAKPAPHNGTQAAPQGQSQAQAMAQAKKVYAIDCALCHGNNGDGKTDVAKDMQLTLDDWTDPKTLSGKTDQELFDIIRKGKDKMPPEGAARAKDDEVKNLIAYIRSLSKQQPAAPAEPAAAPATAPQPPQQ